MIDKQIDPGRKGLSKSLMTSPCERRGYFSEVVRDSQGRRLQFAMPERVLFGSALDSAVLYIAQNLQDGQPWDHATAVALGIEAASERLGWTDIREDEQAYWLFETQLSNALELFAGRDRENGLDRIVSRLSTLRMQGDNGRSLRTEDIIGTPDFMDSEGVIDLKSAARSYSPSKFWRSAEMPVYAWLYTAEHGALPEYLAYMVYVRKAKPEWQWLEIRADDYDFSHMVGLGQLHAARWRKGLAAGDPDLFSFDTTYCGDCPWKEAIPDVGHEGCRVGQLVPVVEEAA